MPSGNSVVTVVTLHDDTPAANDEHASTKNNYFVKIDFSACLAMTEGVIRFTENRVICEGFCSQNDSLVAHKYSACSGRI